MPYETILRNIHEERADKFFIKFKKLKNFGESWKKSHEFLPKQFYLCKVIESFLLLQIDNLIHFKPMFIVRKEVPALPPLFQAPTACPSLPPLLNIFVSLPLFTVPPLFKVFQTVPPTLTQIPPTLIRPTNLSWFRYTSKGRIYKSNCGFLSKINFNLLNPFTNRLS